jgi:hypothetical protein
MLSLAKGPLTRAVTGEKNRGSHRHYIRPWEVIGVREHLYVRGVTTWASTDLSADNIGPPGSRSTVPVPAKRQEIVCLRDTSGPFIGPVHARLNFQTGLIRQCKRFAGVFALSSSTIEETKPPSPSRSFRSLRNGLEFPTSLRQTIPNGLAAGEHALLERSTHGFARELEGLRRMRLLVVPHPG